MSSIYRGAAAEALDLKDHIEILVQRSQSLYARTIEHPPDVFCDFTARKQFPEEAHHMSFSHKSLLKLPSGNLIYLLKMIIYSGFSL